MREVPQASVSDEAGLACAPGAEGRFAIQARCHPSAGFDAAVDEMSRLVLRCRACNRPVLTLAGWELDPQGSDI